MELVTTVAARNLDIRFRELLEQGGRGNAEIVFEVMRRLRGRGAPVDKVIRHECRHDEGVGNCSAAPRVEA